jgi:hypothetical protein
MELVVATTPRRQGLPCRIVIEQIRDARQLSCSFWKAAFCSTTGGQQGRRKANRKKCSGLSAAMPVVGDLCSGRRCLCGSRCQWFLCYGEPFLSAFVVTPANERGQFKHVAPRGLFCGGRHSAARLAVNPHAVPCPPY